MITRFILICISAFSTLSAFTALGCKHEASWKSEVYEEHTVKPQSGEVKIPAGLWSQIVTLTRKPDADKSADKEGEASQLETVFEPLKVFLIERNKGVLKGHNIALSFAPGGGELDLHDWVQLLRGSFYVAFEYLPKIEKPDTKVFFLSNSIIRKVGSDVVGSGCDKYFDLSKTVSSAMMRDGFLLNTSDQRHVSALAGTYVFASIYDRKLHLASLVIHDEEHRALQCRH